MHPTAASDGERDPAEDIGDGAGAGDSSATVDPMREKTTAIARWERLMVDITLNSPTKGVIDLIK